MLCSSCTSYATKFRENNSHLLIFFIIGSRIKYVSFVPKGIPFGKNGSYDITSEKQMP